jgi:hypothetical protein
MGFRSRFLVWIFYLAAWTTALVMPMGKSDGWHFEGIEIDFKFVVAKTLHVGGYVLLAGLSGWLRVPLRYRWLLMFLVMGHATLTEMIQLKVESWGRTGLLEDVAIDNLGVALGTLLTWKWWQSEA